MVFSQNFSNSKAMANLIIYSLHFVAGTPALEDAAVRSASWSKVSSCFFHITGSISNILRHMFLASRKISKLLDLDLFLATNLNQSELFYLCNHGLIFNGKGSLFKVKLEGFRTWPQIIPYDLVKIIQVSWVNQWITNEQPTLHIDTPQHDLFIVSLSRSFDIAILCLSANCFGWCIGIGFVMLRVRLYVFDSLN